MVLKEAPSDLSSRSGSDLGDFLRLRLAFNGVWEKQDNGQYHYVGGETYLEKLPLGFKYADLMHWANEKTNGATIFKYTPPGEKASPSTLVTVLDDEHVEEMKEDYLEAAASNETPSRRTRLQVYLSKASEKEVFPNRRPSFANQMDLSGSVKSVGTASQPDFEAFWHSDGSTNLDFYKDSISDTDAQMLYAEQECLYMYEQDEAEEAMSQQTDQIMASDFSQAPGLGPVSQHTPEDSHWESSVPESSSQIWSSKYTAGQQTDVTASTVKCGEIGVVNPESTLKNDHNFAASGLSSFALPSTLGSVMGDVSGQKIFAGTPPSIGARPLQGKVSMKGTTALQSPSLMLPSALGTWLGNGKESPHTDRYQNGGGSEQGVPSLASFSKTLAVMMGQEPPPADSPHALKPQSSAVSGDYQLMDHFHVQRWEDLGSRKTIIGEGTFGQVLHCKSKLFGDIAVKKAKASSDMASFAYEVCMLSKLNHPNVLRFYGVVTEMVGAYDSAPGPDTLSKVEVTGVMTEFAKGSSLAHYLRKGQPKFSLLQKAKLARQAVSGLMYLHKHDIVHFDLKPDNLLLDYPLSQNFMPVLKVADFGLSRYKVNEYATGEGYRGTWPYMAPEIITDNKHVTERADIWSLGMLLCEMSTQERPFASMQDPEIRAALRSGHCQPEITPEMEAEELEWVEVIGACCRLRPEERFSLEMIAALLDNIIQQKES